MKLTHIRIKDFRSFVGEHGFDLTSGVNYFVGPNNSGKSNLLRAIELVLDPDAEYVPERDRPVSTIGVGSPRVTRITLTFQVGTTAPESTLLKRAKKYEMAVKKGKAGKTYADDREVRLVASFAGGVRQTTFSARGAGAASLPADSDEHQKLEEQMRSVVRFAVVHSGEDLDSLLQGKFREILQLVIGDHLGEALSAAEDARSKYLEHLQTKLLEPLRSQVRDRVSVMFPEVTLAELVPDVPTVEQTLSSVDVRLGDVITTGLADKGTGLRGGVLVAMLQYLAEQSRRSLVLAVEEPEAFLHPGAQEAIRDELSALAKRADVTLLVTTHSPYVISKEPESMVSEVGKSVDGATRRIQSAAGDSSHASVLGSLYRDAGMASVLDRSLSIPDDCRGVVITEGYTDAVFVRAACEVAGRPELMDGLHVIEAGGSKKMIVQAVLARSATQLPVVALLDSDDNGRRAQSQLEDFGWSKTREILSLSKWPGRCAHQHDVEIESLIPEPVALKIVSTLGEPAAVTAKRACGGSWHYEFSDLWKKKALESLRMILRAPDASGLVWVAEQLNERIDLVAKANKAAAAHLAAKGSR
ncbi:AAA family ATPase [Aeromicrobium sp. CnD17-E]|uniref:AAA family ATPase n=1 Tax=Aeromicrobium sp. CnD17-E TaxID=2954487 RepID=UPI002097945E|nr:AAA family ATPase [Aeromicrobium sp. CnD17-E]MCO7237927.1 AAA family ATPase [Aeromicrobium sp. CnD17-E]